MLQSGTVLDKKYRIEAVIGQGSFGQVYRARDQLTSERVAIKELVPDLAGKPQAVDRFIQEAQAALRLTHANIARTYGIFQDGRIYYMAMEYLPGGSLADLLRFGPLPTDESLRITDTLCGALAYAHQLGVIHCGIKPSNVLFDAGGGVHLADFGLAHVPEGLATQRVVAGKGTTMGTVRNMAPEQLEGVCHDPRVDVYALGALLYEMLAGQPYLDFESETTPEARRRNADRIQSESPRTLRALNPDVPPWLAAIVTSALRKKPEQRYASVAEMQRAVATHDAGQPQTVAVPEPQPEPIPAPAEETEPGATNEAERRSLVGASAATLQLSLAGGSVVPLVGGSLIIGRGSGSDLVLSDAQVSRHHVSIDVGPNGVQVVDLDSANGTFVNDERLARQVPYPLRAGDTLRLGESTVLDVQARTAVPARQSDVAPLPQPQPEARLAVAEPLPPAPSPDGEGISALPSARVDTPAPTPQPKSLPGWIRALLAGIAVILLCLGGASVLLLTIPGGDRDTPAPAALASSTTAPGVSFTHTALPVGPSPEAVTTRTATLQATPVDAPKTVTSTRAPTSTTTGTPTATPTQEPTATPAATVTPAATSTSTQVPTATPAPTSTPTSAATALPAPVIAFLNASPEVVVPGNCAALAWGQVIHASGVVVQPDVGSVETPGSERVCPTKTTTYVLTATGPGGTTTTSVTVSVQAVAPDLVVESIVFNPPVPVQGQSNEVRITLRNAGTAAAGPFAWEWQPASAEPRGGTLPAGLGSGASTVVIVGWRPSESHATLATVARVDTGNAVAESDEANNELAMPVQVVQGGLPDLVVESIDFLPFPPQQGLGNQVIITLRNDGSAAAGPFDWSWQPGLAAPWTGRLVGLDAGDTAAVTFIWLPASWHTALSTVAEVDTANEVVESKDDNNRLQVDVEVVQRP